MTTPSRNSAILLETSITAEHRRWPAVSRAAWADVAGGARHRGDDRRSCPDPVRSYRSFPAAVTAPAEFSGVYDLRMIATEVRAAVVDYERHVVSERLGTLSCKPLILLSLVPRVR